MARDGLQRIASSRLFQARESAKAWSCGLSLQHFVSPVSYILCPCCVWRSLALLYIAQCCDKSNKSPQPPPTAAGNLTLLAFAADRRAAVDVDRKAAMLAADVPHSS